MSAPTVRDWLASGRHEFTQNLTSARFRAYLIKPALGVAFCYGMRLLIPNRETLWSIVSVVLVLAPDDKDAIKLAFDRMKANWTGALIGWLAALTGWPGLVALPLAVPLAILVCLWLRLGTATRSALAGLVIVYVRDPGMAAGAAAFDRAFFVMLGCLVGLLITIGARGLAALGTWLGRRRK